MRVLASEDKEKCAREENGRDNQQDTKTGDAANDGRILPAQSSWVLAARESRPKNIGEQMSQDCEHHCQAAESAHFREGVDIAAKKTNQKNRNLSLEAKENGIGRELANEALHRGPVLFILR